MIDSISFSLPIIRLKCPFIKGTELCIKASRLEYGHNGESLDGLRPRIDDKESPPVLEESLFFKIVPSKTSDYLASFEEVESGIILSPQKGFQGYYYRKPCLPDFGYEMGKIIWISPTALKIYSKEEILDLLPGMYEDIWSYQMANTAWTFLKHAAQKPSLSVKMESSGFDNLIKNLSELNQKHLALKTGIIHLKKVKKRFLKKEAA